MQRMRWVLTAAILCSPAAWAATPADQPSGIDLAGIDHGAKPGDDFFGYANGGWIKSHEIPPDRSSYGTGSMVQEATARRVAELIAEAAKDAAPGFAGS